MDKNGENFQNKLGMISLQQFFLTVVMEARILIRVMTTTSSGLASHGSAVDSHNLALRAVHMC